MASEKQISANRRNAQKSTGPRTEEGKSRSRQNAYRHGLTAQTVINPVECGEEYSDLEKLLIADYEPQTTIERILVERLASLLWRLRRAVAIETGLFLQSEEHNSPGDGQPPRGGDLKDSLWSLRSLLNPNNTEQRASASKPTHIKAAVDTNIKAETSFSSGSISHSLANIDINIFERVERYEVTLWRQAAQTIVMLNSLQAGLKYYGRASFRKYPPAWK